MKSDHWILISELELKKVQDEPETTYARKQRDPASF